MKCDLRHRASSTATSASLHARRRKREGARRPCKGAIRHRYSSPAESHRLPGWDDLTTHCEGESRPCAPRRPCGGGGRRIMAPHDDGRVFVGRAVSLRLPSLRCEPLRPRGSGWIHRRDHPRRRSTTAFSSARSTSHGHGRRSGSNATVAGSTPESVSLSISPGETGRRRGMDHLACDVARPRRRWPEVV